MTLKKWAWNIFENTGNLEAYLAMKEAENQEKKVYGKVEFGADNDISNSHINGEIDGIN